MVILDIKDLPNIRGDCKDKKIVFCSGSFDLTHAGHVLFFEDCKKLGDLLFVAVARDVSIKKRKGEKRPILNEHLRLKMIDSLKPVDYVFMNPDKATDDLLFTIKSAFEMLKPDIYVINEDAFDIQRREQLAKEFGVQLVILPRTFPPEFEGISTSIIIEKIKNL